MNDPIAPQDLRPITLTFNNNTGATLAFSFNPARLESGREPVASSEYLPNGKSATVYSQERSGTAFGPKGVFTWALPNGAGVFTFLYDHPFGSGPTSVTFLSIPGGFEVVTDKDDLNHHSATATYDLKLL